MIVDYGWILINEEDYSESMLTYGYTQEPRLLGTGQYLIKVPEDLVSPYLVYSDLQIRVLLDKMHDDEGFYIVDTERLPTLWSEIG
jgi:hypothetical protein